jgi:hypothetical protein
VSRKVFGAALVLVLLALAGCGGGGGDDGGNGNEPVSKEEYERVLADALLSLGKPIDALGTARTAVDAGVKAERIVTTLRRGADTLDAVVPPEDVADPHERLVGAMREFAQDIEALLEQGAQAKPQGVEFNEYFLSSPALQTLDAAAREIREAGYRAAPGS